LAWLVALWLFFDQAFLRSFEWLLSTFLLSQKEGRKSVMKPVDKSVVKLWKDSARWRSCWLGAIALKTE
jgi:hypothetical protein